MIASTPKHNFTQAVALSRRTWIFSPLLAATFAAAMAAPLHAQEAADPPELTVEEPAFPVHGSLWARVRSRSTSDQDDTDLFTNLRIDFGDVDRYGFAGRIAGVGLADLDGRDNGEFSFYGTYDSYSSRVQGRLHLAYIDMPHKGVFDVIRLGRQQLYNTPEFAWFDGLAVEHGVRKNGDLVVGAFVGAPVRLFDLGSGNDIVSGAHAEFGPWQAAHLRLDYMRFEDESLIGAGGNDLIEAKLRQAVYPGIEVSASYSNLDTRDRDMEFGLTSYGLGKDLVIRASWYELLEPQGTLANELDPFTSSTYQLNPYKQGRFLISKGFGESLVLEAGVDARRVSNDADKAEYNHDFERYHFSSTFMDLADTGVDVTATLESLRSTDTDTDTWALNLQKELTDDTRLNLGSDYSLYKYDQFLDTERDHVRSYYVGLRHAWRDNLTMDIDYVYENDEIGQYNTIRIGMRWSF